MSEIIEWVQKARTYAAFEEAGSDAARRQANRDRCAGRLHEASAYEREAMRLERAARIQRLIANDLQGT